LATRGGSGVRIKTRDGKRGGALLGVVCQKRMQKLPDLELPYLSRGKKVSWRGGKEQGDGQEWAETWGSPEEGTGEVESK